jgi:hypothetical protein
MSGIHPLGHSGWAKDEDVQEGQDADNQEKNDYNDYADNESGVRLLLRRRSSVGGSRSVPLD